MANDSGRSPDGSGHSAEPEPSSTVSAVPVSVPNADDIMRFLRWKRGVFRDATAKRATWGIRPDLDHVIQEMVLDELISEIECGEHHALQSEGAEL